VPTEKKTNEQKTFEGKKVQGVQEEDKETDEQMESAEEVL
jgi:hypothetical protein